jgi:hypothetical protein
MIEGEEEIDIVLGVVITTDNRKIIVGVSIKNENEKELERIIGEKKSGRSEVINEVLEGVVGVASRSCLEHAGLSKIE